MKYLSYIIGVFILILSMFFLQEYIDNHTYYFSMLASKTNWYIVVFGLLIALGYVLYLFLVKQKTWKGIFGNLFLAFALFTLVIGLNKGSYVSLGYLIELINYLILFSYFFVILLGSFSIGDLALKKINFKESIYNFSIKFGFGFAILSILLYFVVAFRLINIYIAYLIFFALGYAIFYNYSSIKSIGKKLIYDFEEFTEKVNNIWYIKYLFYFIFVISLYYIFIGVNYTFIAYPTAWDASHAYIYYPKVFVDYNGYPWNTDFRPSYILWSAVLAWVGKLGFWTWFATDTWMIVFNFLSGVLSLFFGFMLINILVKILDNKTDTKHYSLLALGYILIVTWLTSGMGAFLVFVDNKTDLAVLMYVILGLFLALYYFSKEALQKKVDLNKDVDLADIEDGKIIDNKKELENEQDNNLYIFIALSGFFFAIANLIKATATFDFFETVIAFAIIHSWILLAIGAIVFVVGVLSYLKYRGFDQAIDSKYAMKFIGAGFITSALGIIQAGIGKIKYLFSFLIFIFTFLITLLLTKGTFGLLQAYHDKNVDANPKKIVQGIIMGTALPTIKKDELTGSLYTGLKEVIGSAYNEDNNRYKGYGNHDFGQVWWSFMVPDKFKKTYCVNLSTKYCKNGEYSKSVYDNLINEYSIKIFNNFDQKLFERGIDYIIQTNDKNKLAKQLQVNENQLKEKLTQNIKTNVLRQVKANLQNKIFDINKYPDFLRTDDNKKLLEKLSKEDINYTTISIPYDYLIPFNVTFNRSLQNLTSYYTDIGIVWLLLAIIMIFAIFYALGYLIYGFVNKDENAIKHGKLLLAFSLATLTGWGIWYFVAAGIVWYNIGGIIWLIITSVIFSSKLKDKGFLIYTLIFVSTLMIILNLFRIASQGGQGPYMWYKASVGEKITYKKTANGLENVKDIVNPYTRGDLFNLQFKQYNAILSGFDARNKGERGIIGGTYAKYFITNQDQIKNDQFLIYLWKLGSDNNVEKFYQRLKDQHITDIALDPNIASVVMGTGNISLWYRYFGKLDKNGNFVEEGVLPHLVDLSQLGKVQYVYSNNLAIKYALIYSDEQLAKILNVDKQKAHKIRYYLIALRFLQRNIGFEHPILAKNIQNEAINAYGKIIQYRFSKMANQDVEDIANDIIDIQSLNVKKGKIKTVNDIISMINDFNNLTDDEKQLVLILQNYLYAIKQNPQSIQNIVNNFLQQGIQSRAQVFYVKIK